MKIVFNYIALLVFFLGFQILIGQERPTYTEAPLWTIKGSVRESDTYKPIPEVNIEINGGSYTVTDNDGRFTILARKGDELIVSHEDFETVYYTISSNERITIEVEPEIPISQGGSKYKSDTKAFNALIDSVSTYMKKDAGKSIQFVAEALAQSNSVSQNAEAYEVLGDVYTFWKQYDLAISNYRISLQNEERNDVKLKLGKAYELNKNNQESLKVYNGIKKGELTHWQLVVLYEGLGDTYFNIKKYTESIDAYQKGLKVAQDHLIAPKITDLNSKIAQVYSASGQMDKAEGFFNYSLDLAEKENKKRAVEEKIKIAEFNGFAQNYPKEIELRKEALKEIQDIEKDSIIGNESPLTPQKQNYKIGNAYYLQQDYANAIPYLEKSIKEADSKEDLIVKKDASRKLSDVYVHSGDYEKALDIFKEYTATVDELYIKKEQEISRAARFNRSIAEKQNRITSLENERQLSESKYQLTVERNKNQQIIIYSLMGGVILLLVTAYFMFKYIKQQRLANNLLALKSLRSQMNPHFIFNALNSVNSFIATNDERTANKYLSDFSFLMRAVLENSEEDFIPLEKEIELLELYTELEHFRFKDKFDYQINVDNSINVKDYKIPPMLLQPYIENAVWHGLRYKTKKGHLNINISPKGKNEIAITITDDGIGRERSKELKTQNQQRQNSKGMGNIKKRVAILNAMYKDKVDVSVDDFQPSEEDTGTKVVVTLKKD